MDEILTRHDYPEPVANLLGEACALAALVGSSLKFEGRLIIQAQGSGPVAYVVADYDSNGSLRGYCRFDADRVAEVSAGFARPGARTLLGDGVFIMTVDPGPDMERYQGVTPIEGETLALCAETYFAQSEQVPTRVRLAVGQTITPEGVVWRAGGLMLQNVAEDDARGSTDDAWTTAQAFFETVGEDELASAIAYLARSLGIVAEGAGAAAFAAVLFGKCPPGRVIVPITGRNIDPAVHARILSTRATPSERRAA